MGDEDKTTEPSLELPKLFGRKKTRRPASPEVTPEVAPEVTPEPAQAAGPAPEPDVDETATAHDETQVIEQSDDATQVIEQPERQTVPSSTPSAPPVAPPPAEERPLFADEAPPKPVQPAKPAQEPKAAKPAKTPKPLSERREPIVTGRAAAAVTGLLVGAAMVGATAGALRACEAVQGTATCGAAGFPILLAIVVGAVMVGSALLRAFRVPDAGSTSFLAVGSLAVIALLVFIDVLDRWWMVIVIPLVGVATYLLSHWVTTTFADAPED